MKSIKTKNEAAVALGRLGGQAKSEKKTLANRANAKKGGRPKSNHKVNSMTQDIKEGTKILIV